MPAPTPAPDRIMLTALPNGRLAERFRLSLLITPNLINTPVAYPFLDWPAYAAKFLQFDATFYPKTGASLTVPLAIDPASISPPREQSLWQEIFCKTTTVKARSGHQKLHRSWRISHDITSIRNFNQVNRLAHAYRQIQARGGDQTPDTKKLKEDTSVPPIFLHADFNAGTQSDLAKRIKDRSDANTDITAIINALPNNGAHSNYRDIVKKRFDYGVDMLENWGDARLSAAAVGALLIFCLSKATRAAAHNSALDAAINQVNAWFAAGAGHFQADYPEFADIPAYIELILFHQRKPTKKIDGALKAPDFHQLMGLVHNYPAIMRELCLVYDFVFPATRLPPGDYSVAIALHSGAATLPPGDKPITNPIAVVSCRTRCSASSGDFAATPSPQPNPFNNPNPPPLIAHGLLNLQFLEQLSPTEFARRFSLVAEDADGHALKTTAQSNNQARGTKYQTSAPTAYNAPASQDQTPDASVPTPAPSPNPVTVMAAGRTVGLSLFDNDRLGSLEKRAGKFDESGAPTSDFYAEDINMGYRVDVLFNKKFYSLCARDSCYDIFVPVTNDPKPIDHWSPTTDMEKSADEGFSSFGATQSPLSDDGSMNDDDAVNSMTQVHQAMFTWTGWSLSVPAPGFSSINRPKGNSPAVDPASTHLAIRPIYTLSEGQLPPLRFNTDYTIRCRLVDLAGNGPPAGLDPGNTLYHDFTAAPFTPFSRHEPIRAPQFLLREPIDRHRQPGTHINRVVAHDNDASYSRMLVPPRESLRMAELSGFLKSPRLPASAFGDLQLEVDGSFPSVARAKKEGWIGGTPDIPNDNDPIYLAHQVDTVLENRYYPDPLANFIRIQAFVVTDDDPAKSTAHKPVWLKVTRGRDRWPDCKIGRVHLVPTDQDIEPQFCVDQDFEADSVVVPTLVVTLPRAYTVVLRISSAAFRPSEARGADHDEHDDYSVHLSHLISKHKRSPTSFDELLPLRHRGGNRRPGSSIGNLLQRIKVPVASISELSDSLTDGSVDMVTPKRSMTLVHAVKQPLAPAAFPPVGLKVKRDLGKPEALVSGQLGAHWRSTAKITCYASWVDRIDDLKLAGERKSAQKDVAFTLTLKDLAPDGKSAPTRLRDLPSGLLHHLPDTRAHEVTYSLSATTNFREYYVGADEQPDKHAADHRVDSEAVFKTMVLSSVRPQAPSLVYVIPAFVWAETYDRARKIWYQGRTTILRAYFERPFLLSGDNETVAVALFDPNSTVPAASQNHVCRWGADPTREITTPILHNELSEVNLTEPGAPIQTAFLAEGGTARFKPCKTRYDADRSLWYADIPIDIQHANSPFVRLALARWQPDALQGSADTEARCSQVIFAEFMQIAAERWVSLQRKSASRFRIAISGAFPSKTPQNPFRVRLQKRWYPLGRDTGWRNVDWSAPTPNFVYQPPDEDGISCWSTDLHTPHSAYDARYRLLLTEDEMPGLHVRTNFFTFMELP